MYIIYMIFNIMNSNDKRQTNFRKYKFIEDNRQEYEQFIRDMPSSFINE